MRRDLLTAASFATAAFLYLGTTSADDRPAFYQARAQDACSVGPTCKAVGAKAQQYTESVSSRIKPGMGASEAAAQAYCLSMVVAEASRVCGDELAASGQSACASQAYAQRDAALKTAEGSELSSRQLSSGEWKANCGW